MTAREGSVEGRPSYEELFDAHAQRLHRLCRLLLKDHQEAEEVVQEVFLRLHKAQEQGPAPDSPGAWLTRVAANLCHDRNRAGWWPRWRHLTDRIEDVALAAREPSPEHAAIQKETLRRIWSAFHRLSDRQREVFVLRYVENLPYEEIAPLRGVTVDAARHLAHRARAVLRERIPHHESALRGS